ncbi:GAF and ANTAR domain-containing protein [Nonomuraea sp. NBC_01738]|uniref:GAF and ANTAR domain-containing protein n=1 Tax=Nonomuraea sp. NBC_01738 TaxID=2976003 RepID=UPI002E0F7D8F|nr:GAF and ANTAR domain-containing protein [Nonomuraea sp. NBC_01738]
MSPRERRVRQAFVELADTLAADFALAPFLGALAGHTADLPGVAASGVLLAGTGGVLDQVAVSEERARAPMLAQPEHGQGPCVDAFHRGEAVRCADLAGEPGRWPVFRAVALAAGFAAVTALPMRLRSETIGALTLFADRPGTLEPEAAELGQALIDVATVGLLQERAIRLGGVVTGQLQGALTSRVLIEQAKGVLAERLGLSVDAAFELLRGYARDHNHKLTRVAGDVVEGKVVIPR